MPVALLRYLMILHEIPTAPGQIDAVALARRLRERGLEVTLRTVQRDLIRLSKHFPLRRSRRGKPYRWSWGSAPELRVPRLPGGPRGEANLGTRCFFPRRAEASCVAGSDSDAQPLAAAPDGPSTRPAEHSSVPPTDA